MSKKFNEFRFGGLNHRTFSNKYYTMNRVSENGTKVVVKVADSHIIETRYGYALILDSTHVVFLKPWAVSRNWYGNEVLLDAEYFNVREWGEHDEFMVEEEPLEFGHWVSVAQQQQDAGTEVKWAK